MTEEEQYISSYTISTATEFIELFSINGEYSNVCSGKYIFRGLRNEEYPLIPSALREKNKSCLYELCSEDFVKEYLNKDLELGQISAEYDIIRQFYDIADRVGLPVPNTPKLRRCIIDVSILIKGFIFKQWLPESMFNIAGLAQHYGLPTRLLDWTYDYKVGFYFAVSDFFTNFSKNSCDSNKENTDAVLWAMNYSDLQWLGKANKDDYCLHFYRPDYSENPNLAAQKGLFSVWQLSIDQKNNNLNNKSIDIRSLDNIIIEYIKQTNNDQGLFNKNNLFYKFIIPKEFKKDILKQLDIDGYNEANLFPSFKSVSQYIHNRKYLR